MIQLSVICWMNNKRQFERTVLPYITEGYQVTDEKYDLYVQTVTPMAGATTIGQAYNLGRAEVPYQMKLYCHQDVRFTDRRFVHKLNEMLSDPCVGAVGVIGSVIDTGAAFFHAPIEEQRGRLGGFWWPQREQVKLVDGFMLATKEDIPFSEEYESVHMAVEDYCMRVRQAGKQVWTIDAIVEHDSPGKLDDAYWRSAYKFRRKWAHMLPGDLPPLKQYVMEGVPGQRIQTEFQYGWL